MNIPTKDPRTNMIAGLVTENKSLESNNVYVDRYPNSTGGVSIVTTKSLPVGHYRGSISFISKT